MPELKNLYCRSCEETTVHEHITDSTDRKLRMDIAERMHGKENLERRLGWNFSKAMDWGLDQLQKIFGEGYRCTRCGDTKLHGGSL